MAATWSGNNALGSLSWGRDNEASGHARNGWKLEIGK